MRTRLLVLLLSTSIASTPLLAQSGSRPTSKPTTTFETLRTKSDDGLPLTADLYRAGTPKAPTVLLFHQAASSRGEYRRIAPRLQKEGYNCLALDARSGRAMFEVPNASAREAAERKLDQSYEGAQRDLERAVDWARELKLSGPIVVWGSSYSASLVLFVASRKAKVVSAVLAFSPGEYLRARGRGSVRKAASKVTVPVFITCAPSEAEGAKRIADAVSSRGSVFFVPKKGSHGSRTLLSKGAAESWKAVLAFLAKHAAPVVSAEGAETRDSPASKEKRR